MINLWHVILAQTWTHSMLCYVQQIKEKKNIFHIFSLKLFIVTAELMTLEGFYFSTAFFFKLIWCLFPRNMCLWVYFFAFQIQIIESYGIIALWYGNTTQCMFLIHLRFYTLHNHSKSIEMIVMYSFEMWNI
jgi:hypothetical protein